MGSELGLSPGTFPRRANLPIAQVAQVADHEPIADCCSLPSRRHWLVPIQTTRQALPRRGELFGEARTWRNLRRSSTIVSPLDGTRALRHITATFA